MPAPPTPFHILRTHHAAVSCIAFNETNLLLYAGDQAGYVSITDLKGRRVVRYWKAHEGGVLSVVDWNGRLISHGRDNVIHLYKPIPHLRLTLTSGPSPSSAAPEIEKSLPTNSLNFCRLSLLPIPHGYAVSDGKETSSTEKGKGKGRAEPEALLAVPSLVDSESVDVYLLPDMKRLHASISAPDARKPAAKLEDGKVRSGLIMALQLGWTSLDNGGKLGIVIGFEDGRVEKWGHRSDTARLSDAGSASSSAVRASAADWRKFSDGKGVVGPRSWKLDWVGKGHNEAAKRDLSVVYTVSADHQLVKYEPSKPTSPGPNVPDITSSAQSSDTTTSTPVLTRYSVKQIGNASIALTPDERVVAVGGWDGKIRLFSAATGKPLGTLPFHRETSQVIAFPLAPRQYADEDPAPDDDERSQASRSEAGETSRPSRTTDGQSSVNETMEIGGSDSDGSDTEVEDGDGTGPTRSSISRWIATGGKDTKVALWQLMDFAGSSLNPS